VANERLIEVNQNDKGFYISFVVKNKDGSLFDLTGYAVKFNVADPKYTPVFSGDCEITDDVNGECRYLVIEGNLSNNGIFPAELELTLGGKIISSVKKMSLVIYEECG